MKLGVFSGRDIGALLCFLAGNLAVWNNLPKRQ